MEGFLSYQGYRYLKWAIALSVISAVIYIFHDANPEPNGGTWYGYILGTVSALIIFWLIYFGRRKRDYTSNNGTLKGWLSGHIYLGTSLLVIATLHTGFQWGWNVHTLAYVLMCLAVFSGFYGAWAYLFVPERKRNNLDGRTLEEHFSKVEDIDRLVREFLDKLSPDISAAVASALDRTEVGGSLWDQLSSEDKSLFYHHGKLQANEDQKAIISVLVTELSSLQESSDIKRIKRLIDLFSQRKNMLRKIREDIRLNALLQAWLFFHVPISIGLLAALFAHVFSVFIYW